MSWDRPSDAPSSAAEPPAAGEAEERFVREARLRGEPLLEALERHAPGARAHADAAAEHAHDAAAQLGLAPARCELVREAARLHEIGLVYVPAELLAKPVAERSAEDSERLAGHYEVGARLARGAGLPDEVCDWILAARKHFADARAAEEIPLEARILRAACACAATLGAAPDEPGQAATTLTALRAAAGAGDLDPRAVEALGEALGAEPE